MSVGSRHETLVNRQTEASAKYLAHAYAGNCQIIEVEKHRVLSWLGIGRDANDYLEVYEAGEKIKQTQERKKRVRQSVLARYGFANNM
jgi:hypothetical protein